MDEILKTAKSCRHYAMCKIDFLGSGICASGPEKHYVSFYPQGRMDLYAALVENRVPITDRCIEIADSCNLCGLCDYQCYFVTELRPSKVMAALKDYVADFIKNGGKVQSLPIDSNLADIQKIVGEYWATNGRAIAVCYSHDPCPIAAPKMPDYVVMPNSKEEISSLLKLFKEKNIPYAVRGNGSSVMGFVMSEGAVITAFDLQVEAQKRGFRVNVAEPSALVCANVMCSGIFSTFSYAYGTAANNYVNAEFVAKDGSTFSLNDKDAPNLFSFSKADSEIPGICTSVSVKLHPVTDDEGAILVPFESLEKALDFSRDCAVRRIGLALGILGGEYFSTFLAPTKKLADDLKDVFTKKLGIAYLVMVVGDKYVLNTIRDMGYPLFDQKLFKTLCLGMPSLKSAPWLDLLTELSDDKPFSYLQLKHFTDLADTALAPSPAQLTQDVDPELRSFFEKIYSKPEMTNLVWLTMFRIISSRMGREKHVVAFIIYLPIENELVDSINKDFKRIADKHSIKNDYGFITPLDNGKRCVFEYDYYLDQNDPDEIGRMQQAMYKAGMMIEGYSAKVPTVKWIRYVLYQGFCRMENLLYT